METIYVAEKLTLISIYNAATCVSFEYFFKIKFVISV